MMIEMGRKARAAAGALRKADAAARTAAIRAIAAQIRARADAILAANAGDVVRATRLVDRLRLDPARLEAIAAGVDQIAALPDPVGVEMARWQRPLHSFAYRYCQNRADAEDLVAQTFVRLYQQRLRLRPDTRLSAWLFTTLTHLHSFQTRVYGYAAILTDDYPPIGLEKAKPAGTAAVPATPPPPPAPTV